MVIIQAGTWDIVQLLSLFVGQFAISFPHIFAWPSMSYDHATVFAWGFSLTGNFSDAPAEIRHPNIFCILQKYSHSICVDVECIPSTRGQEMMSVLQDQRASSISSTLDQGSASIQPFLMSSTNTDKNSPCFRWTNTRRCSEFDSFRYLTEVFLGSCDNFA